jgi:hypothetical protein
VRTYARTMRTCFIIPWKPRRVEWLCYFWEELLIPARSGLGLCRIIVPYFTMLSPRMLVVVSFFPVSMENRDLG